MQSQYIDKEGLEHLIKTIKRTYATKDFVEDIYKPGEDGNPDTGILPEVILRTGTLEDKVSLLETGKISGVKVGGNPLIPDENQVVNINLDSIVEGWGVIAFDHFRDFPEHGEDNKLYIDLETRILYQWTGSNYKRAGQDIDLREVLLTDIDDTSTLHLDRSKIDNWAHTHILSDIEDATDLHLDWGNIDNVPDDFTPADHTHIISDITDIDSLHLNWNNIDEKPNFDEIYYQKEKVYNKEEVYSKDQTYSKDEVYPKGDVYKKTEAYSKEEVDDIIDSIVIPETALYNHIHNEHPHPELEASISGSLDEKADKNDVYTKEEVDDILEDIVIPEAAIEEHVNNPHPHPNLEASISESLAEKADKDDTYTKEEVYSKEETYSKDEVYPKNEVYSKEDVDSFLNTKVGYAVVDEDTHELVLKSTEESETEIARISGIGGGGEGSDPELREEFEAFKETTNSNFDTLSRVVATKESLEEHINEDNPHHITKETIGLDKVLNYSPMEILAPAMEILEDKVYIEDMNTALAKKVSFTDVVDDLETPEIDKPLSANQGVIIDERFNAVNARISSFGSALIFKGTVSSYDNLPSVADNGDCYQIFSDESDPHHGEVYAKVSSGWTQIVASAQDMSSLIASPADINRIISEYRRNNQ